MRLSVIFKKTLPLLMTALAISVAALTATQSPAAAGLRSMPAAVTDTQRAPQPEITINPESGPKGTMVTFTGTGFTASQPVSITFDDVLAETGQIFTSGGGRFSATVEVPALSVGPHPVHASDGANVGTTVFTIIPTSTIEPEMGYVGTKITLAASGFMASHSIELFFHDMAVKTAISDPYGSFSATFAAPSLRAGIYSVRATDGENSAEAEFTIALTASMDPVTSEKSPGHVGSRLTLSGASYESGDSLSVTYDGEDIATADVGPDRSFSVTFDAPPSEPGQHTITISDEISAATFAFYMESEPPPTPVLTAPLAGDIEKGPLTFTWDPTTDPSGVTYDFEIATDSSFSPDSIVLQKTGLTTTEYALSKDEKLKPSSSEKPYFWHVRAIDGASNQGSWSDTWSVIVGTPFPAWAIWMMIGMAALIIGLFAVWLGRHSSSRKSAASKH